MIVDFLAFSPAACGGLGLMDMDNTKRRGKTPIITPDVEEYIQG